MTTPEDSASFSAAPAVQQGPGGGCLAQRILITGATSAIGSALAQCYARAGVELYLHGRNVALLQAVVGRCREAGATVHERCMDIRDFHALRDWLSSLEALDLVVVNAGMNIHVGPQGQAENWADTDALIDLNLKAAMLTAQAVLPAMRAQGRGQIAFMSSLAAYHGLPVTPAYCASKAGVKAYGEALRGWLASEGIRVSVIMPGYVESPMCNAMPGPKPFLWKPERAAAVIRRGLARDKARISFPFPLNLGCWFLAVLPARVSGYIVRLLGYGC